MPYIENTYYRVAEHLFTVKSSNQLLLSMMVNYEPFKVLPPLGKEEKVIFTLQIAQNGLLTDEQRTTYQHIFTDQSEEDMPRIEVYKNAEAAWLMRVSQIAQSPICCEIACNADFTDAILYIDEKCKDVRFCIDNALMLIFAFRTASLMTLEMHAAVVVKENEDSQKDMGYLFLGHSGTGKSTHAQQWLKAFDNAWLLNDDNPILRIMNDGEIRVYGSPWSGKTPCYKNTYTHVGGIIKLSQAPHNQLHTVSLPHAYAYMLSSVSGLKMDRTMADYLYESIKYIITHVNFRHLECLPDTEAAKVCWKGIKDNS